MPLRILIVTTNLQTWSGWGTFGRNTVQGLQVRGHTVAALVQDQTEDMSCNQYAQLPNPLLLLGSPFAWIKTARAIRTAIRQFQPDVIHIQVEPYALAMPFVKKIPWVLSLNGTYSVSPLYHWLTKRLMVKVYTTADHIFTPSNYTASRALEAIEQQCDATLAKQVKLKITRFKLGIEQCAIQDKKNTDDQRHILYVGGIKPRKGIAEIIEGFAKYQKQNNTPVHLHLVGTYPDDGYRQKLVKQIEQHQLASYITFHGRIGEQELDDLYAKADLFIMLSKSHYHHFEGFGLVFLEANMRGIPTIGSKDSGCAEAIDEGVSGYSVHHDQPELIAERIHWILDEKRIDPANCRKWAELHSINQQCQSFEEIYTNVLSRSI